MTECENERTWNRFTGRINCQLHDTTLVLKDTFGLEGTPDGAVQMDMLKACYDVVCGACDLFKSKGLVALARRTGNEEVELMRTALVSLSAEHAHDPVFPCVVHVEIRHGGRLRLKWRQEADDEHIESVKPDLIVVPDVQSLYWVYTRLPKLVRYEEDEARLSNQVARNVWQACASVGCPDGYRHATAGFSKKF